jgi:uncharacterized protein (TIGR02453 family)
MLQTSTLKFLKDLKKNNNKPWFDAHRGQYDQAKGDFEQFIGTVISAHAKKDPFIAALKPKDCMFRINRDVRFSKDKSPYKTNFGASINRGGKKSVYGGYYIHVEPAESFVGGGIWMPQPPELKKLRQEVDYCFEEFSKIISAKKFKAVYGALYAGQDASLSRVPQGFDCDSPAAAYLKLKSYLAMKKVTEKELLSKGLVKETLEAFDALQPLLQFINRGIEN